MNQLLSYSYNNKEEEIKTHLKDGVEINNLKLKKIFGKSRKACRKYVECELI